MKSAVVVLNKYTDLKINCKKLKMGCFVTAFLS